MIVLPFSTDRFAGAAAIERHGSGIALYPNACSIAKLEAAVTRVLAGTHGSTAENLGARLRREPGPDVESQAPR